MPQLAYNWPTTGLQLAHNRPKADNSTLYMLQNVLKKFFSDRNQRLLKKLGKTVNQINALESSLQALSNDELAAKTIEFKARFAKGADKDELLAEAFAVVREASVRTLELRHFDVQMIGGIVLNEGKITEMKTGEGKTLAATLPAYLNAVSGCPVHIVTVNDYLAQRDAEWMGEIYSFLGLTVGVILSGQDREAKKTAYQSDIVYGTNNEFGFDYLRDNMAFSGQDRVQNGLGFGIIDEVDSILIDEARTPLIISGPGEESTDLYNKINTIVPELVKQEQSEGSEYSPGDFSVDEKSRQVTLTEEGHEHAEELLTRAGLLESGSSLYEVANIGLMHHLNSALRAINLFNKDVDYIVKDNAIVIIDEFTGRMMPGRRWSEGLHQAIEAKEGVIIQQESQTLASITFQNYFRLYDKLAGMTGTADTEAPEFLQIYGLEVVIIPTNKEMRRDDSADLVYRTADEKYAAICEGIEECRARSQPVLVGTASIETSEHLSQILEKKGIEHQVLNAKHHGSEAKIIAEAGRPGNITIATNMAGRGTDIVLGGNLEVELNAIAQEDKNREDKKREAREQWDKRHQQVIDAGGLHVLGTERNESRRVDNQLRGRCGRQGDPGSSRFFLSLEDNLMRIFGSQKIAGLMEKLGMEEGEAIEHTWVTRAIENAQKKVEGHNFDMRKQLLEYDDVANEQRKVIYEQRNLLMETEDISEYVVGNREEVVNAVIDRSISPQTLEEQWEVEQLEKEIESEFGIALEIRKWLNEDDSLHQETLRKKILRDIVDMTQAKEDRVGSDSMRHFEKQVMLKVLDSQWKEHLANMDYLRQGIGLRGYAQKNPKQEYKREAFEMFTALLESMKFEVISVLAKVHVPSQEEMLEMEQRSRAQQAREQSVKYIHHETAMGEQPDGQSAKPSAGRSARRPVSDSAEQPFIRDGKKIGRNQPCPCGSGKKFKQCHGKV